MAAVRGAHGGAERLDLGPFTRLAWPLAVLAPGTRAAGRRAVVVALLAWLPLALLAAAQGLAWGAGPDARGTFLGDVSAHVRYLIALPALLVAQSVCFPRLASIARHFDDAGLVPEHERARFAARVERTRHLFDARSSGLVILALAFAVSLPATGASVPGLSSTWVAPLVDGAPSISAAGIWRALVSQPLLLTVALTWLWRMTLWAAFLWHVSRLDLSLVAAHPDGAGGLSFVATSLPPLAIAAFGLGAWVAGVVGAEMREGGWSMRELQVAAVAIVALVLLLFAGPLLMLVGPLRRVRLRGLLEYDRLAGAVGRRFEAQWLGPGPRRPSEPSEALTFSDTVDLYGVVSHVHAMRLTPITLTPLLFLAAAALLPMVPVLFLVLPVEQALEFVRKLVL